MAVLDGYGQTLVFKGELLSNNLVVKNYTVIIDGNPATTNESGVFSTAISSGAMQVQIKASDKKYVIVYPIGGRVLIPKDQSLITEIVLEDFQSSRQIKSYMLSFSQLKDAAKKGQSETKALQAKIDSIVTNLKKLGYTNEDLRIARERQDGIDLFYPEISATLQNYILQAQSLMIAFKFIGTYAFVNINALTQYSQTQNGFNQAFEKLFVNYPTYSKKMVDYWKDPSLSKDFNGITDTLIYGIGKNKIVPLNDLKNQINQYFQNQIPEKEKEKQKKEIQSQIAVQVPVITVQLSAMELRVKEFLDRLKN
jgi:hypothetical protein